MIVVTGGAGFIGSNLVKALNTLGRTDILVIDELTDGKKFFNLADCDITDYMDKDEFLARIEKEGERSEFEVVFHLGACSDTTEWDGRYMMRNNYSYSKSLLHYCVNHQIPLIYASSAAVYGGNTTFVVDRKNENPLNVYGYSKWQFDQYVRQLKKENIHAQVTGLRYFNVYGPQEQHKGKMASTAYHFNQQLKETGIVKLFAGCDGYTDGEQRRDFVFVDDVVDVNLWFWKRAGKEFGIYNIGTGKSQTFNEMANAVIDWYGRGRIEYIPFPPHLQGHYQSFTEADITPLRSIGYDKPFKNLSQGVGIYLDRVNTKVHSL